ncbi:MAG: signal peptidase II [Alphaproteobacteria bacterium]|nr:signal peptidase II [Alphaproteobacteria bacterium]
MLDIAVKSLFLARVAVWDGKVVIPGLLDLHYAWNHGVSFSLFWQNSSFGSVALAAVLSLIIIGMAVAAFRTNKPILATSLGLIVGGALGNVADRYQHGGVFDFLVVRLGAHPLFICNSADILISLGVLLLSWDAFFVKPD